MLPVPSAVLKRCRNGWILLISFVDANNTVKKLWLPVVFSCLSGCDRDPGAPPQAVDLAIAAQLWNTPEKQWSQVELQQLPEGERLYRKGCAGCHLSSGEGQLTLGAPALRNSAVAKGRRGACKDATAGSWQYAGVAQRVAGCRAGSDSFLCAQCLGESAGWFDFPG